MAVYSNWPPASGSKTDYIRLPIIAFSLTIYIFQLRNYFLVQIVPAVAFFERAFPPTVVSDAMIFYRVTARETKSYVIFISRNGNSPRQTKDMYLMYKCLVWQTYHVSSSITHSMILRENLATFDICYIKKSGYVLYWSISIKTCFHKASIHVHW